MKINEHFFLTSQKIINIINKLYPKIEEEIEKNKNKQSSMNNEIDNEDKVKALKKEKDIIEKQYQEEIAIYQAKIEKLETENKIMTEKLLQSAKNIIKQNVPLNNNSNNVFSSPSSIPHESKQVLRKNRATSSMNGIGNQNSNNRIFTLKMMKDTIYEIYNSKVEFSN